jgi:hypothetical protein
MNFGKALRGAAALLAALSVFDALAAQKPNIVHIVADDLGWKDVGFNGCTDIKTPNIDALAKDGARFTQFYVQPMCTPTRAALMTGRYPFRYGLQTIVIPGTAFYGLDTDEWLLPQCLRKPGKPIIASEKGQPQALINDGPSITDEGFGEVDDVAHK